MRPALEALVQRMLQKRPEDRFPTWAEARAGIAAAREVESVTTPFFPRLVAFGIDMSAIGFVAGLAALVTRLGIVGWLSAAVAMALLERVWSTPGKRLMRLRTLDRWDDRPGLVVLLGRWGLKLWGPIAAGLTRDLIPDRFLRIEAGLQVVLVLAWLVGLAFALQKRRLALHDRVTRTRVVYALKEGEPKGAARAAPH
jgi:uncharacterized RDD family membrane protein YckC